MTSLRPVCATSVLFQDGCVRMCMLEPNHPGRDHVTVHHLQQENFHKQGENKA